MVAGLTSEQTPLIQRQRLAAAGGTNVLIMRFALRGDEAVVEAELIEDEFKILHVHRGRVISAAPTTVRPRAGRTRGFVKRHAEHTGSLENMEQLSEWNVEQQRDNAGRVDRGDLAVPAAGQEPVAYGQHQAGRADGENQDERQDVLGERLHGALAGVDEAAK